ncbi:hypothetical protein E5288_WYG016310 [Bos mutus]|uniref:Uncharacterized protein n=1 Tax=Bos mutus TaxID=72004 RepID=A0A6B0RKD2_9CETA|nr:hypothetical protein [Bos mutus]
MTLVSSGTPLPPLSQNLQHNPFQRQSTMLHKDRARGDLHVTYTQGKAPNPAFYLGKTHAVGILHFAAVPKVSNTPFLMSNIQKESDCEGPPPPARRGEGRLKIPEVAIVGIPKEWFKMSSLNLFQTAN